MPIRSWPSLIIGSKPTGTDGAKEVWLFLKDGSMEFYLETNGAAQSASKLCPEFPRTIEA